MSLSVALNYAVSGLVATQAQIQVLAGNISNAQTPGYSEETLPQNSDSSTNGGAGVVTGTIQRETDTGLQAAVLGQTTISSAAATLASSMTSSVVELTTSRVPVPFGFTHSPPTKILSRTSMGPSWLVAPTANMAAIRSFDATPTG